MVKVSLLYVEFFESVFFIRQKHIHTCEYVYDNALVSVFNVFITIFGANCCHSRQNSCASTIGVNANDKFPQTRFSHYENCELIDLQVLLIN